MTEPDLYKELGELTKSKDRWKESIPYVSSFGRSTVSEIEQIWPQKSLCQNISIALAGGLSRPFRCQRVEWPVWMFLR